MRIGIFDSGIGGLTVLAAARAAMPGHDLLYLGDTARIPYGTRSPLTVIRYSLAVASWLHDHEVEAIVVACNTASTHALDALRAAGETVGIQVFGVVDPGVEAALAAHTHGEIAVLGTQGTVTGGAYQRALARRAPQVPVHAVPCPLFVPLVEEGWLHGPVPEQVAEAYVGHLRGRVDVAILGCTHYPLLTDVLGQVLPGTRLVDSASATAAAVRAALGPGEGAGSVTYRVTDHVERFQSVGAHFLGEIPSPVQWVDLGPAHAPWTLDPA
ncbi:MAG: glutamate racemase [Myxococcales bacterium]|nr:glutamate racemase [Myxococcales bacterium]